jgi:hypothetical protein
MGKGGPLKLPNPSQEDQYMLYERKPHSSVSWSILEYRCAGCIALFDFPPKNLCIEFDVALTGPFFKYNGPPLIRSQKSYKMF